MSMYGDLSRKLKSEAVEKEAKAELAAEAELALSRLLQDVKNLKKQMEAESAACYSSNREEMNRGNEKMALFWHGKASACDEVISTLQKIIQTRYK